MGRGFYINFKAPEIKEALNDIAKYDTKTAVKIENQVSSSTKAIGKGARRNLTTNDSVDSGDLRRSVRTSFNVRKVEGTISAKQFYAHFPEFGASAVPSRNIPERKAKPYMNPALEAEVPNLVRGVKGALQP